MFSSDIRLCTVLEILVIFFQVFGVVSLCLSRLVPGDRWADRGRAVFIVALIGLGIAGALCGRHDSEFALFAGMTMTALLIGMIAGSSPGDATRPALDATMVESHLAL